MANAVTTPQVEFFKGTGREECETFVRSIRAAAWREDKDDDDRWMANYASLRFAGKGLNWHSRLPPDIRRDWSKLEMALLNEWPSLNDDVDDNSAQVSMYPTPAAAPNSSNNNVNQPPRHGVLKVISFQSSKTFYLGKPDYMDGKCSLTTDIAKALPVSVDSRADPHNIKDSHGNKWRPSYKFSWLGAHWLSAEPRIRPRSEDWARIALVDSITMKSSYTRFSMGVLRITAWDFSVGDDIVPTWFHGSEKTPLDIFIKESALEISIAADSSRYAEISPGVARGRISFQTLD